MLTGVLLLAQACTIGPEPVPVATPTGGRAVFQETPGETPIAIPVLEPTPGRAALIPAQPSAANMPSSEQPTSVGLESPAPPPPPTAPPPASPTTPAQSIRTQAARVVTPLPQGEPLTAFAVADPTHLWIVDDGTLLATTDGGQHWNPQYQGAITDLAFVDAQHGWLTANDTLRATTDGGQTWTLQYQSWPLELLGFVTPRQGWITAGQSLLTTHDGGQTWQTLPSQLPVPVWAFFDLRRGWGFSQESSGYAPPDPKLTWTGDGGQTWQARAVPGCRWSKGGGQFSASGPATGWMVCAQDPGAGTPVTVNRTTDGGRTWVSFPAEGALGAWLDIPQSLFFLDNQHGWLGAPLGTLEGLSGGYLFQATTDGGHTWQPRVLLGSGSPAAANSGLLDYRFLSPTRGYARMVYDSFRNGSLLTTQDGGAHWSALSGQPSGPNGPFRFFDARQGVGVGLPWDSGAVLTTNDGGQRWQPVGTLADICHPAVLVGVGDLSFPDRTHGWALAECFREYEHRQLLVHTTDGGATWQPQAQEGHSGDPHRQTISFLDERSGYLAGAADYDLIVQSHGRVGGSGAFSDDGGATFHLAFTATRSVAEIRFVSTAVGWMRADGQAYASVDGGASWRPLGLDNVQDIDLQANGQGWVLAVPPASRGAAILATTDAGLTWVRYTFSGLRPSAISFADATHGWLRDEQNQFYATADGGASWVPVP